jgi:hypothetical protein
MTDAWTSAGVSGWTRAAPFTLTGHRDAQRPHPRDVSALLTDRRFLLLLPVAGIHWAAMVPYHGFLGIHY